MTLGLALKCMLILTRTTQKTAAKLAGTTQQAVSMQCKRATDLEMAMRIAHGLGFELVLQPLHKGADPINKFHITLKDSEADLRRYEKLQEAKKQWEDLFTSIMEEG